MSFDFPFVRLFLILSVYILMSFDFPFVRLLPVPSQGHYGFHSFPVVDVFLFI